MKPKQNGFTIIELLVALAGIATLALAGGALYVMVHFLAKFW